MKNRKSAQFDYKALFVVFLVVAAIFGLIAYPNLRGATVDDLLRGARIRPYVVDKNGASEDSIESYDYGNSFWYTNEEFGFRVIFNAWKSYLDEEGVYRDSIIYILEKDAFIAFNSDAPLEFFPGGPGPRNGEGHKSVLSRRDGVLHVSTQKDLGAIQEYIYDYANGACFAQDLKDNEWLGRTDPNTKRVEFINNGECDEGRIIHARYNPRNGRLVTWFFPKDGYFRHVSRWGGVYDDDFIGSFQFISD